MREQEQQIWAWCVLRAKREGQGEHLETVLLIEVSCWERRRRIRTQPPSYLTGYHILLISLPTVFYYTFYCFLDSLLLKFILQYLIQESIPVNFRV